MAPLVLALAALVAGAIVAVAGAAAPAIPLVVGAVLGLAFAVLRRPRIAVPLALVLLWTDAAGVASFDHGAPTATAAIVPLLLAVPLLEARLQGERLRFDPGFGWMLAIILAEIAATFASAYPAVGLSRIEKTLQQGPVIYLLVINVIRSPETVRSAAWALIAGGAALALPTLVQELGHRYDHTFFGFAQIDHAYLQGKDSSFRAQGPVADANYYAQILLVSFALAAAAIFGERRRRTRAVAAGCAFVILLAIIFTYSRGAALALVALLVLMTAIRTVRGRHLAAISAVLVGLLVIFPSYGNRVASLAGVSGANSEVGSSGAPDLSIQQRATENKAAWLAIQDHPLLGIGPGGFPLVYQQYAQQAGGAIHQASRHSQAGDTAGEAPQRAVPNLLLSVAADEGVIGVLALSGLLGYAAVMLVRARRACRLRGDPRVWLADGFLFALAVYVVASAFLALAFERYLWGLIALCAATAIALQGEAAAVPDAVEADSATPREALVGPLRRSDWRRSSPGGGKKSAMRPDAGRTPLVPR